MAFIEWSADFSVQHAAMDRQHQVLFGYVNEFYAAIERGTGNAGLAVIFKKIVEFTGQHFADEEAMMERVGFAGLVSHRAIHKQLVGQVLAFERRLKTRDAGVGREIQFFLKHWLTAHIHGIDKKYVECARRDRVPTRAA